MTFHVETADARWQGARVNGRILHVEPGRIRKQQCWLSDLILREPEIRKQRILVIKGSNSCRKWLDFRLESADKGQFSRLNGRIFSRQTWQDGGCTRRVQWRDSGTAAGVGNSVVNRRRRWCGRQDPPSPRPPYPVRGRLRSGDRGGGYPREPCRDLLPCNTRAQGGCRRLGNGAAWPLLPTAGLLLRRRRRKSGLFPLSRRQRRRPRKAAMKAAWPR